VTTVRAAALLHLLQNAEPKFAVALNHLSHTCVCYTALYSRTVQEVLPVPHDCLLSLFIWNIRGGVAITLLIQSHKALSFAIVYYLATSFDPENGSSSGHYTKMWLHTETK
jgi:hypothetical protein